jgi:two-component system chemotaxis sensor kinase CheA
MDDEILSEFLIESRESLDQLDRELVALEEDPKNRARLASIFRTVHTIKGTAGFLQFAKLEAIAHVGENLLSRLRDGVIELETVRTSVLLAMVDAIRGLLAQIEGNGQEGEGDYAVLLEALSLSLENSTLEGAGRALSGGPRVSLVPPAAAQVVAAPAPVAAAPVEAREEHAAPVPAEAHAADPRIRVDVRLLDRLMNLVGELVLARNQLLQHASGSAEGALVSTCQRLNLITTELQEGVMKTRMQPIENVWNRFPRVVRDLAHQCGKQVRLELEGGSTELDKTIIEAIVDPLTHLVRNSIDHGIESPEKRLVIGKSGSGSLRLRAFHEGGRVNIEISDDGNGIDPERVKNRALERGLISPERARAMSLHEVYGLLFAAGFSTAEKVTNISGRGVGLDVVKSNIERLGGSVDIDSTLGRGTTFRIRIPLTLAIIPALMVGARNERFAIPQANLAELVHIDAERIDKEIERIQGVPVYRLRGNLLPLVDLGEVLALGDNREQRDVNLIVLAADQHQFGLLVDAIFDTEEIVVKPLGRELKDLQVYSGATILGDGRVALILDVVGIAERAGVDIAERKIAKNKTSSVPPQNEQQLLLFRSGQDTRMAIRLDEVARLEEIPRQRVEQIGGEQVVQYRGEILPLVYLSEVFGGERRDGELLQVLVYTQGGHSVGFVVDSIDDVISQGLVSSRRGGRPGTIGSAVIQGKVTEILDPQAICNLLGG